MTLTVDKVQSWLMKHTDFDPSTRLKTAQLLAAASAQGLSVADFTKRSAGSISDLVEQVCKRSDSMAIGQTVDAELANGATVFSQIDRRRMNSAIFAPGRAPGWETDAIVGKALSRPENVKYLNWAQLPVIDSRIEEVNKVDSAGFGVRVTGNRTAFAINSPTEVLDQNDQLLTEIRAARPWLTTEQVAAHAEALRRAVDAANMKSGAGRKHDRVTAGTASHRSSPGRP
jgi:hypothetical protein